MEVLWLCLIAVMLALYVILDGFDLGAGILHLALGETEAERRQILQSIGPVWDGNEVWLIAVGGTLYFAFPRLYASSFSGFYLPLMIVLWLLILRGVSIELRNHFEGPIWKPFWDVVFGGSSLLLAVFFGAALGNVVRGVPLEASGYFFLPLWTDFGLGAGGLSGSGGILDWYTISVAFLALATLTLHGSRWIALKTGGRLQAKASALGGKVWWATAVMVVVVTMMSFAIQPLLGAGFHARPWGWCFPLLAVMGLAGAYGRSPEPSTRRFLASCLYIAGMLASAAFGIFPYVLPGLSDRAAGLTVHNASAAHGSLLIGLYWWIPGMILTAAYFIHTYTRFAGKVE